MPRSLVVPQAQRPTSTTHLPPETPAIINFLLGGSGSALGGVATELLLGLGLDGALGFPDGGGAGDGGLSEIRAVTTLGNVVGDVLVGPR